MSAKAQTTPKVDEFKVALDNRSFEIQLFWQRSNYFLVLMTALGIGTFSVKDTSLSPLVSFFAMICSYFWFRTNLGSKFWQEFWEAEVSILAKDAGVRAFEKSTTEAIEQVSTSLGINITNAKSPLFRDWVYKQILKKPSVTYHMILLSLSAFIVWTLVFIAMLRRAFMAKHQLLIWFGAWLGEQWDLLSRHLAH